MQEVKKWLNSGPSILPVQASTKDEAIAFLSSVIFKLPEEERDYWLSKSIVISDKEAFRHIVTTCKSSLLLIADFEEMEIVVSLYNNNYVFIPLNPDNTVTKDKVMLPRIKRDEFISALKKMGIDEEYAEDLSRKTAGSLTVLRRQLSPVNRQPEWAKPEKTMEILPVLLVGKWEENKQGDKEIISEIAGIPYDMFINKIKKWLYKPDSPILKVGEIWRLISPLDAFFALSPFLTKDNFEKLKEVSLKVLREIDPSLDIEPEKRWMAQVYGKEPKYSKTLRYGFAQTLILIAVFGNEVNLGLPYSSQIWVDGIIHELLNNADWKLWRSLSDVLPLIAEASPSSFLEAVENSLSKESPPIMKMFSEAGGSLTFHSPYTSLLWALEGLAWDPDLLPRVTLILGKLAKLDPGGKLANRIINTLRTIFLLWKPHTFADFEQRLKVLDCLIRRGPEIGWKLLINLMPRYNDFCSPTYKPRWRQLPNKTDNRVTIKEYIKSISKIVDKIIKNASSDEKKWVEIMEHYLDLPIQEREKILRELSNSVFQIKVNRLNLWNELRKILFKYYLFPKHKSFSPDKELKKIKNIYNILTPKDLAERYLWLFEDYIPELPDGNKWNNYKENDKILTRKRIKAVQDIKSKLGIEGLIKFAELCKNPHIVGIITTELSITDNEERLLFSLLDKGNNQHVRFVQGYILEKTFKEKEAWIKSVVDKALLEKWNITKIVNFFLVLPQNQFIWNFLEKFDEQIQKEYWRRVHPNLFHCTLKDKIYALEKLIRVKRYFTALHTSAIYANEIPPKLIAEILEKAASGKSIDNSQNISSWDIGQLFKALDQSEEIEIDRILKLEWLYLPFLTSVVSERSPKMLHQWLSNTPEFFVEVIKCIYKPKDKKNTEEENLPQKLKEHRAHLVWELLNTWETIPGSGDSKRIDYQKLKSWIEKARELCKKLGLLEACDNHIGEVLACSTSEGNVSWPPKEICMIIEEIQSKNIEEGFIVGVYKKRGIIRKSLFEGGKQERELAEKYREYAHKCSIQFPKTASLLKKIADTYETEAKHADFEAEIMQLEW